MGENIGRILGVLLLVGGTVLALAGLLILIINRFLPQGRLPGDILIKRDGFTLYIPLTTSIILSIALSIILIIVLKLLNR